MALASDQGQRCDLSQRTLDKNKQSCDHASRNPGSIRRYKEALEAPRKYLEKEKRNTLRHDMKRSVKENKRGSVCTLY